jgi:hypothetical protein
LTLLCPPGDQKDRRQIDAELLRCDTSSEF